MIFASPIIIGAVVGVASAYLFKDNTIKGWLTRKSGNAIFKKKNELEIDKLKEKVKTVESDETVEDTELADKKKQDERVGGDTDENTTEKLKETAESIKEKTGEVVEETTKKVKEAVEVMKEKTEKALEMSTAKIKKVIESVKKKYE